MKTDFLTPVGRLVQGDPFEAQTKNKAGQPLTTRSGEPTQRYFIAVAFKKNDAAFGPFYAKMVETARGSFPNLFDAAGNCTHPRFSWKLMDGDGVDDDGKSNAAKEGFAGHWVVKFSSSFAPRCFHAGHYQPHEAIQDPRAILRGYFVRVAGTMEDNKPSDKPGLYVNLGMIELVLARPDLVISSGPDASTVFGGAAAVPPQGAQPLPMNAATPAMPGNFPAPAVPGLPQVNAGAPAALPATMSLTSPIAVPPNPAFLAGPGGAPGAAVAAIGMPTPAVAPVVGAPPAPPSSPQMTAAAGGATYEQFIAQGWTAEQMRASGYLV